MKQSLLAALILTSSAPVLAAADLAVTIAPPQTTPHVYESARYRVLVQNNGNQNAAGVLLTIALPATNTSPGVAILGDLGSFDTRCAVSGTNLVCPLGTIAKRRGATVDVNIALPYSSAPMIIGAQASTTSAEPALANNEASLTASPLTYAVQLAVPATLTHQHCTGTDLTSFFECELFPSSISTFDAVYNDDEARSMTFGPEGEGAIGTWSTPAADRLQFVIRDANGLVMATFDGRGVSSTCFEGPTVFPDGDWVAIYQVCMQ